jgi:5-formyltetrahydrofolate cyclo-ligase
VEPDLVLVPLLAFDRTGARLGYGQGHYDRTLAALRARRPVSAIGLAFAAQEVACLPAEPHDIPLDGIVTETAYIEAMRTSK